MTALSLRRHLHKNKSSKHEEGPDDDPHMIDGLFDQKIEET
jgi:hypothetical protein